MEKDELGEEEGVHLAGPGLHRVHLLILLFTAVLIVWSIERRGAASRSRLRRARTPNPSKAPWYFLGLQELLVYFDPWIAGVLLARASSSSG